MRFYQQSYDANRNWGSSIHADDDYDHYHDYDRDMHVSPFLFVHSVANHTDSSFQKQTGIAHDMYIPESD